jgi:hypothetical protein
MLSRDSLATLCVIPSLDQVIDSGAFDAGSC